MFAEQRKQCSSTVEDEIREAVDVGLVSGSNQIINMGIGQVERFLFLMLNAYRCFQRESIWIAHVDDSGPAGCVGYVLLKKDQCPLAMWAPIGGKQNGMIFCIESYPRSGGRFYANVFLGVGMGHGTSVEGRHGVNFILCQETHEMGCFRNVAGRYWIWCWGGRSAPCHP